MSIANEIPGKPGPGFSISRISFLEEDKKFTELFFSGIGKTINFAGANPYYVSSKVRETDVLKLRKRLIQLENLAGSKVKIKSDDDLNGLTGTVLRRISEYSFEVSLDLGQSIGGIVEVTANEIS